VAANPRVNVQQPVPNGGDGYAIGVLGARVENIDRQLSAVSAQFTAAIATLSAKIDEKGKTQWPTLVGAGTLVVAIMCALGGLAYAPVLSALSRISAEIVELRDRQVPRAETEQKWEEFQRAILANGEGIKELYSRALPRDEYEAARLMTRQDNANAAAAVAARISAIEAGQVSRGEHEQRWESEQRSFSDMQRQIDELKQAFGGIYGARDVIIELRERLDRIEREPQQ
jgi:Asp-tRNA(Asn)/Glu-tRNA(Gln) amidotransferase A subunit family amidase